MGSPLYASPEQLRAPASVDARADIWALGAILFELVAGKPPFRGGTLLEICTNVMYGQAPPLSEVQPEVPRELDAVVARSLAKNPAERFGSIADLALALAPFASARSLLSVERIENVVRRASQPADAPIAPSATRRMREPVPCAKTLPSRSDPPGAGRWRKQNAGPFRRWVASIGAAALAGAVIAATVARVATGRSSLRGGAFAEPTAIGSVTQTASQSTTATATPTATATATASATTTATMLPEPAAIAPLSETPVAPGDPPPRAPGGKTAVPPRRRVPDTSQFGGLQ
jgi:serine/threonine-protein kinase